MSRIGTDKKKIARNAGFLILFLAGLLIALYPAVSSRWNAMRDARLISDYKIRTSFGGSTQEYEEMIKAAQAYNKSLFVPAVPDAFSIRDGIRDQEYEALLDTRGDGMMGYVEIPVIGVELPLYHYTTEESLLKGAGHLLGSSLPVGGEGTHSVVSAHRGLPNAEMFTNLNLLREGDRFYYHILNEVFAYEADEVTVVLPTEVEGLSAVSGKDYSTLITCTPYGLNSHRLLVRGHRIPYEKEVHDQDRTTAERTDTGRLLFQILSALAGFVLAALLIWLRDRIKRGMRLRQAGKDE